MRPIWILFLGISVLAGFLTPRAHARPSLELAPTPSDGPEAIGARAKADSLAFAAVSKRVRPGSRVRVFPSTLTVDPLSCRGTDLALEGFRCGWSENEPQERSERRALRWTEISTVQIRENSAKTGGVVGAALLGFGVLGVGIAGGDFFNPDTGLFNAPPGGALIIMGSMIGFASGALLGTAVGSLIPKWSTVYEATQTSDDRSR